MAPKEDDGCYLTHGPIHCFRPVVRFGIDRFGFSLLFLRQGFGGSGYGWARFARERNLRCHFLKWDREIGIVRLGWDWGEKPNLERKWICLRVKYQYTVYILLTFAIEIRRRRRGEKIRIFTKIFLLWFRKLFFFFPIMIWIQSISFRFFSSISRF